METESEDEGFTGDERDDDTADIADIATLHKTSDGTVKARTNATCHKAGGSGRPHLLCRFIENLIARPVTAAQDNAATTAKAPEA